jgi:hypothetical protein
MPTVIATSGAVNANSYITIAEGDTYHTTHLYPEDWTSATDTEKETAVIMATRLLDHMYEWAEYPSTDEQALQWPRDGIVAFNRRDWVEVDEIPIQLKNATAEFARQLLAGDRSADSAVETQGIKSLSAGSVSLSFKDAVSAKVIPDAVDHLIPHWWGYIRGNTGTREILRG